ncbi:hypothetical protein PF007_g11848 [Phytophthora fragariae]|uniref:MULE transposase domain-containing protein n=2 Tax=Phytophthora fragariae TaxID=53985 RepID=A0A6A3F0L3_9STRA|nr:hypothetical protein PF003_g13723 [Phytophthora fragariae]KAE8939142.1 hypothetical protein PF009_g11015 [Phytophthora fragariae]KAE9110462.1 hypothetical protein PF007_g11848 [Phytophthora fragariae]KAE9148046.1 hypothetical protein PF006_g7332 [Phytophthora fragariae]
MSEITTLHEQFPGARILLCEWHVKTYLSKEICDRSKYEFSAFERSELETLTSILVDASSESTYDLFKKEIYATIQSPPCREKWKSYFDSNWDNCRDMWARFARANVPHLGNTTNNRLESSWAKLKREVKRHMHVDECIVAIMHFQRRVERDSNRKLEEIYVVTVIGVDKELQSLAQTVSKFAFDLVREQYDAAMKYSYKQGRNQG